MSSNTPPSFPDSRPIGVLDSGVGGLSILREVRRQLPGEDIVFIADQAHVPYGPRTIEQVRDFTEEVARFLIMQHVKIVVVACNTASAAALYHLRATFPEMPFVGMEPAVKPAARDTQTGVIGVIATEATFQGELYASVVGRFAQDVQVQTQACPEFVLLAESGEIDTPRAHAITQRRLAPLLAANIDQLVLGCTHFSFLADTIKAVTGTGVTLVDPSAAVARQAGRVLSAREALSASGAGAHTVYYTSGAVVAFRQIIAHLLASDPDAADVRAAAWDDNGHLHPVS
ncbi:MAG: glutamate racemase [Anaerolineae bacterium]|nr:glutamate racemase [Anaerolineae bacterium]